jgi:hypothetical protein
VADDMRDMFGNPVAVGDEVVYAIEAQLFRGRVRAHAGTRLLIEGRGFKSRIRRSPLDVIRVAGPETSP